MSVPDAEMLNRISEELDTPVNILLGKYVEEIQQDTETEIDEVAKQLALVNSQLSNQIAKSRDYVRKVITAILIIILLAAAIWATHFCKTHGYISNNMQSSGEVIYVSDAELNIIK